MPDTPAHLRELEASLAGLAPSASGLNRDRLLYEAGQRTAPTRMFWPLTSLLLAGFCAVLALQPAPRPIFVDRYVPVPAPVVTPPSEAVEPAPVGSKSERNWGNALRTSTGYLSLRDQVLFFGAEALPAVPSALAPLEPTADVKTRRRLIDIF